MTQNSFFIERDGIKLYTATFIPEGETKRHGTKCLLCHPLLDEKKSSHRFLAELGRKLATHGVPCVMPDLSACGDSGGDATHFDEARWIEDLNAFVPGIHDGIEAPSCCTVGIRFGASLAMRLAEREDTNISKLVLIDPVINGMDYLDEIIQQKLVREMMTFGKAKSTPESVLQEIRKGHHADLDGFTVPESFIDNLSSLDISNPNRLKRCSITLILQTHRRELPEPHRRFLDNCTGSGCDCMSKIILSPPFWKANDICEFRKVLDETASAVLGK
ncbi:MAG: alpha/beta fold hydrolase [Victivallales bacterium]|nr:alpha/beta fold hydrolase [Victivallales bacterium]